MKKILYSFFVLSALLFASCEDFTDLQPKGKNLLSTTTELELLLNNEFYMGTDDFRETVGDMIYAYSPIANELNRENKTRDVIKWTWDDKNLAKMAELTSSDSDYADWYSVVGTIANPILAKIDAAEGDESVKAQLKAEALTLRAYFQWLLVNKFAKAYNPATAESDPGIPYVLEDWDLTVPTEKWTVGQVYEQALKDINDAIALNALPNLNVNRMRMSLPAAYAVKAHILMSMQKYDEAKTAAEQSLAINPTVNDYNSEAMTRYSYGYILGQAWPCVDRPHLKCEEDLFYTYYLELFNMISTEALAVFEDGHASKEKIENGDMMYDYMMGKPEEGGGYALSMIGLPYLATFDLTGGWNGCGLKTTHMYLIVAEANIRNAKYDDAMEALDKIRVNRIDPAKYQPLKGTVTTEEDAIFRLKQTSHGENCYSLYNFINKKRWNQCGSKWEETLTKNMLGKTYTLAPDSPMWIFPFPQNATNNNPNLLPHNNGVEY
ncbi:MAG: RagB/SusD family nutrient uptake outer membrane protein [Bacteroidales bacterium]|nr:RagB/SusD family nutrient uptake outer membrane protein [Bacteroidales bacterium]